MTANINTQNGSLVPDQVKLSSKTASHLSSSNIKDRKVTALSVDTSQANKNVRIIDVSGADQVNKISDKKLATDSPSATEQKDATSSKEDLNQAVKQLNSYIQSVNRYLQFSIDTESGETVIKVTDAETDKVIRQIPSEETLKIARQIDKMLHNDSKTEGFLLSKLQA